MQIFLLLMVSHKSFSFFTLFYFLFFLFLRLDEFHSHVIEFTDTFFHVSLFLNPSVEFFSSIVVFFGSVISVWYFLLFSITLLKILPCFIHCSPDLNEHFNDHYFELLIRKITYLHLFKVCFWSFISFFCLEHILDIYILYLYFFIFLDFPCWFLCIRKK